MRLEFATKAQAFAGWAEAVQEDLVEDVRVRTPAALQEAEKSQEEFKATLPAKQDEMDVLLQLASDLEEAGAADNAYTCLLYTSPSPRD